LRKLLDSVWSLQSATHGRTKKSWLAVRVVSQLFLSTSVELSFSHIEKKIAYSKNAFFVARRRAKLCSTRYCYSYFMCPSVLASFTLQYCVKMAKDIVEILFPLCLSPTF